MASATSKASGWSATIAVRRARSCGHSAGRMGRTGNEVARVGRDTSAPCPGDGPWATSAPAPQRAGARADTGGMSRRVPLTGAAAAHRAALWRIAAAQLAGDDETAADAARELAPLLDAPLGVVLAACADAVADVLLGWADDLGLNPACLAEMAWGQLQDRTDMAGRLLLTTAASVLFSCDPTGEAGSPHEHCTPWPEARELTPTTDAAHGAILDGAVHTAERHLPTPIPAALVRATPALLAQLVWGRSGPNPDRMQQLLAAATTPTAG